MRKSNIFGILSLLVFVQNSHWVWASSNAIKTVSTMNDDESLVSTKSLFCIREYFGHHFHQMSKVRFNIIQDPLFHRSLTEQNFIREANDRFHYPLKLISLNVIAELKKNYLIFLSSKDLANLKNVSLPEMHEDSFLYIFLLATDANVSLSDVYSAFTPSFDQNIVLMTASVRSSSTDRLFKWNAYRILWLKCNNSREFKIVKVGECFGDNDFHAFPLKPVNNASCPIQVAAISNPPLSLYDPKRGFYSGIEYQLLRVVANRMQTSIKFVYINFTIETLIFEELFQHSTKSDLRKSVYLR